MMRVQRFSEFDRSVYENKSAGIPLGAGFVYRKYIHQDFSSPNRITKITKAITFAEAEKYFAGLVKRQESKGRVVKNESKDRELSCYITDPFDEDYQAFYSWQMYSGDQLSQ